MTLLSSNEVTDKIPQLVELRKLKSQTQSGERRRQLQLEQREAVHKIELKASDPAKTSQENKSKRKKRNFFKWLFTPLVSTSRQVAPPPRVRVKIPIVYRNGEHKGVVVGGLRVPFSRPMQANRRSLMLSRDDMSLGIPEDTELVLEFPNRLASEEYEIEHNRKQEEHKKQKREKLARELAK